MAYLARCEQKRKMYPKCQREIVQMVNKETRLTLIEIQIFLIVTISLEKLNIFWLNSGDANTFVHDCKYKYMIPARSYTV